MKTEAVMLTIRLAKADWAKAWRAMIELAPVRLVADDPLYEVLPAHLELLTARGFSSEVVPAQPRRPEKPTASRQ
jgi:hypothetical protein